MLNVNNGIYLYNYANNTNVLIREFIDEIVEFEYEPITSRLFIAFENKVQVYSYPGNDLIQEISSPAPIKSLDLRFTF